MRGCSPNLNFQNLRFEPVLSNYDFQRGPRHDQELPSVFGHCSANIYGGLCPYCVLFLMEECHLNERIVILVIHGSEQACRGGTRLSVSSSSANCYPLTRFRAIQGAHILHPRIRYDGPEVLQGIASPETLPYVKPYMARGLCACRGIQIQY